MESAEQSTGTQGCAFELVEASIDELRAAYETGQVTVTQIVDQYLARIEAYDRGPNGLRSIVVMDPRVRDAAAESDRRWRARTPRALEGIPFTVKDSYMAAGLTVAAGSPAFASLVAQWDAFTVAQLTAAGAILIGKTNMPPMADGGMQRGLYGRAESPYNRDFLAAAYGSGSSNGSGVSTAANLAMFGMGEETVSSGRSPAANNALCAYTPSWGILSIRGNWPLFPARDVVVPHTRSMPDMLQLLDVLVQDDPETRGDFWRHQRVVPIPRPSEHRPESYLALQDPGALAGKRIAVPAMYLGEDPHYPLDVRPSILQLWGAARARLEQLGAEVVVSDFSLMTRYEGDRPGQKFLGTLGNLPSGWSDFEFTHLLAFGWDDFLRANGDPQIPALGGVDSAQIYPTPPGALPDRYERVGDHSDRFRSVVEAARRGIPDPREHPDFARGVHAIIELREELFETWLEEQGFDAVVFPSHADVGPANADTDEAAADIAWANGVRFSHGNYALRHIGLPTVTVAMGVMADIGMPVGLTFVGAAYDDPALLGYAAAFEAGGNGSLRRAPELGQRGACVAPSQRVPWR
ncbi:N-carbamoylputrescine amidase [Leucobacter sp. 7(1)]|uniref:amidase n=1 Tax=Leucobacter sp. 7(1) TaxID=1255613 RepID=UPI00097F0EF2|nr:amidase [Leucobacter sp. 7(1)]SJN11283.1 N-carbamoylputrescine amidase [Leucobacter sp. 7(1)]